MLDTFCCVFECELKSSQASHLALSGTDRLKLSFFWLTTMYLGDKLAHTHLSTVVNPLPNRKLFFVLMT